MTNHDLETAICGLVERIIAEGSGSPVRIGVDDRLLDDGLIDSLSMVNLLLSLSSTFDIDVPGSEVSPENFGSVAAIARVVQWQQELAGRGVCGANGGGR